jgi:hypothetical protein
VQRWGGNATTRYSWQDDIANHASDWFFYNIPNDNANPQALPFGSASDQFVLAARGAGAEPLVTVPTIGWTPSTATTAGASRSPSTARSSRRSAPPTATSRGATATPATAC